MSEVKYGFIQQLDLKEIKMGNNPNKPDYTKLSKERADAFWEAEKSKPVGRGQETKPKSMPNWLKKALTDRKHFAHDELTLMRDLSFEECREAMAVWEIPEFFYDQVQVGGFTADECAKPSSEEDTYWVDHKNPMQWDKTINRLPWSTSGGRLTLMEIVYNFRGARCFREILSLKGKWSPAQKAFADALNTTILKFGIENDFARRLKQYVRSQHNPKSRVSVPGRNLWFTQPDGTPYGGFQMIHGNQFGWTWPWAAKQALDAAWREFRVLKIGESMVQMQEDAYNALQAEKKNPKKLNFKEKVEAGKIVIVHKD